MPWIAAIVSVMVAGGGYLAYATGFDAVIYRTIMNWSSDTFVYVVAKGLEYFISTLDYVPNFSLEQYQDAAIYFLSIMSLANTIFPIVEFVGLMAFTFTMYLVFIAIRNVLKIMPGMGG